MHHSPAIAHLRQQLSWLTGSGLIGSGSALKLNLPRSTRPCPGAAWPAARYMR